MKLDYNAKLTLLKGTAQHILAAHAKKQHQWPANVSVAKLKRPSRVRRARGADGAQTLQGPIFGLEIPIDARGEPGGGGAARRQHPRRAHCMPGIRSRRLSVMGQTYRLQKPESAERRSPVTARKKSVDPGF